MFTRPFPAVETRFASQVAPKAHIEFALLDSLFIFVLIAYKRTGFPGRLFYPALF